MSNQDANRRGTDPLIIEMHGMISSLVQEMKDHVKVDDKAHLKIDEVERRLIPIEDFHSSMRTAGKVGVALSAPSAAGIGYGIWLWVKAIISHGKVNP